MRRTKAGSKPSWKHAWATHSQALSTSRSPADACTQEEPPPDFCLNYLDLVDMAVHTVCLADLVGMVRLLSVVNSLERPVCQVVTRRWEALCAALPMRASLMACSPSGPQVPIWIEATC